MSTGQLFHFLRFIFIFLFSLAIIRPMTAFQLQYVRNMTQVNNFVHVAVPFSRAACKKCIRLTYEFLVHKYIHTEMQCKVNWSTCYYFKYD